MRRRAKRNAIAVLAPAALAALALALATVPSAAAPPIPEWDTCTTFDPDTGEPRLDALCFFDVLVERYRRLAVYKDTVRVLHVTTERDGASSRRVETQIGCAVDHGRLSVLTPGSTLRRQLGLDLKPRTSRAMHEAALKYNIWLAPHMALKFADVPNREFRSGVEDGFTAIGAKHVTVDDKPMVRLELKSGDGLGVDPEAQFDLYVNPDSMLVERIEGQQRLPDGATYETTLNITPLEAEVGQTATGEAPDPALDATTEPIEPTEPTDPEIVTVPVEPVSPLDSLPRGTDLGGGSRLPVGK